MAEKRKRRTWRKNNQGEPGDKTIHKNKYGFIEIENPIYYNNNLKSIDAVGKLTYANAVAIRDGKTNGEMHEAMEAYQENKTEMYEYLLEQNSKK